MAANIRPLSCESKKSPRPICSDCKRVLPNQIVFAKIERLIGLMQDEQVGLLASAHLKTPTRSGNNLRQRIVSSSSSSTSKVKQPTATALTGLFTGSDLIQWLWHNLELDDQQEANHLANLIASHGYIFPIEQPDSAGAGKTTSSIGLHLHHHQHQAAITMMRVIKNDNGALYRFQAKPLWPSRHQAPLEADKNADYAIYLCKRNLLSHQAKGKGVGGRTKYRHSNSINKPLADYEMESFTRLQRTFERRWDFIQMEAECQAKLAKKRDKLERNLLESQERAFWDLYRPVPGCVNTTELDIKKACRLSKWCKNCDECLKKASTSASNQAASTTNSTASTADTLKEQSTQCDVREKAASFSSLEDDERQQKEQHSPETNKSQETLDKLEFNSTKQPQTRLEERGEKFYSKSNFTHKYKGNNHTHKQYPSASVLLARESLLSICSLTKSAAAIVQTQINIERRSSNTNLEEGEDEEQELERDSSRQSKSSSCLFLNTCSSRLSTTFSAMQNYTTAKAMRRKSDCRLNNRESSSLVVIDDCRAGERSSSSRLQVAPSGSAHLMGGAAHLYNVSDSNLLDISNKSSSNRSLGHTLRLPSTASRSFQSLKKKLGDDDDDSLLTMIQRAQSACSSMKKCSIISADSKYHQLMSHTSSSQQQQQQLITVDGATLNTSEHEPPPPNQLTTSPASFTPPQTTTTDCDLIEAAQVAAKQNKLVGTYLSYFNQWCEYDPFMTQPIPSNPWLVDSQELWEVERQTKEVHCRRVRRWAFSLKELLNDPAGREQFHRFLEKEFSAENLRFWDSVQQLKRIPLREVERRVQSIWCEFLARDSNCPINIDSKSYESSKENMTKNRNNRYIFDQAANHVYQLMKNDSYPRYLRSEMYKDYKESSEKNKRNTNHHQSATFDVFKPQISTLKHKFNF